MGKVREMTGPEHITGGARFRGNAARRRPFHNALPWGPFTVMVTSSEPEWTASSKPSLLPMLVPPPPCGTVAPPRFW